MIFVAITEHSPAQCPGSSKEAFDVVAASMPHMPELEKKHGVKNLGTYIMMGSHKNIIVMDAPSYDAAEMVLLESKLMSWNTIELAQARTPEEAMALAQNE